jgi:site-specific recombinase XerD
MTNPSFQPNKKDITAFGEETTHQIRAILAQQHAALGQLNLPSSQRTSTARNYASAISLLAEYMQQHNMPLPSRSLLERWRDDMLAGRVHDKPLSIGTVNGRLAAVRKLLRATADDVTDVQVKLVLRDWANVTDAKAIIQQDKTDEDYGLRLARHELEAYISAIPLKTIKGLRDRALIAVMAGAGLRVSEAVNLNVRDVFLTANDTGQRGIRVRRGKHHKARIVVLGGWNNWVLTCVQSYTTALGLTTEADPEAPVFRGVKRAKNHSYDTTAQRLSVRGAERAVQDYDAPYRGASIQVNAHDLRRTFAKLCKEAGMTWEALREQMGHSSVTITEDYVGHEVEWSARIPNWTITLPEK